MDYSPKGNSRKFITRDYIVLGNSQTDGQISRTFSESPSSPSKIRTSETLLIRPSLTVTNFSVPVSIVPGNKRGCGRIKGLG